MSPSKIKFKEKSNIHLFIAKTLVINYLSYKIIHNFHIKYNIFFHFLQPKGRIIHNNYIKNYFIYKMMKFFCSKKNQ